MELFGEEEVMGVDESSERLSGVAGPLFCGYRAIVVRDVFALVFPTCDEGRLKSGRGAEYEWNTRFI